MTKRLKTIRTIHLNLTTIQEIALILYPNYLTTLDSHAEMCTLGKQAYIFQDYNRLVYVEAYDPRLGSAEYCTVSGTMAYTDLSTGRMLLLLIHQTIHIPHLYHHLLCPMQYSVNDVTVNETPKFMVSDPTDQTIDPSRPGQPLADANSPTSVAWKYFITQCKDCHCRPIL